MWNLASNCYTFDIPGMDVEICCGGWFGGNYLFFKGMSGEHFSSHLRKSWHHVTWGTTHGEAQPHSCGFQQDDSLISRDFGPSWEPGKLAVLLLVIEKLRADLWATVTAPWKTPKRPWIVCTGSDSQIFLCKLNRTQNGKCILIFLRYLTAHLPRF